MLGWSARSINSGFIIIFIMGILSVTWGQVIRPNLILIMADDLGINEIGPYGQTFIKTPTFDKMAKEGLKFENFYTGSPVCGPARCNLMTGLHNGHCRLKENDQTYIRSQDLTVAEVLKHAGYITGMFGKWGLSWDGPQANRYFPESFPTRQGFDEFLGYRDQRHAHNFYPTFLVDGEDSLQLTNVRSDAWNNRDFGNIGDRGQGNADPSGEKEYSHTLLVERALDFVDRHKDTTFFMYLPFTIPHLNNEGASDPDGGWEVPSLGQYANVPNWTVMMKSYAAQVTLMDEDIGKLITRLETHGIDNKTLILFTSDNGPTFLKSSTPYFADGSPTPDGRPIVGDIFDGNGIFRGYKRDTYEGGIRMPTLAYWPGVIAAGRTTDHQGYFPDVLPTFADLAGVTKPTNIDGISFADVIKGDEASQEKHDYIFWSLGDRAIRKGDFKYVREGGVEYLFNIKDDPGETTNLRNTNPQIFQNYQNIWNNETKNVVVANWTPGLTDPAITVPVNPNHFPKSVPFQWKFQNDFLTIQIHERKEFLVEVVDVKGKVFYSKKLTAEVESVSTREFSRGIYYLRVTGPLKQKWNSKVTLL